MTPEIGFQIAFAGLVGEMEDDGYISRKMESMQVLLIWIS
jgi:hypothetical protein